MKTMTAAAAPKAPACVRVQLAEATETGGEEEDDTLDEGAKI